MLTASPFEEGKKEPHHAVRPFVDGIDDGLRDLAAKQKPGAVVSRL